MCDQLRSTTKPSELAKQAGFKSLNEFADTICMSACTLARNYREDPEYFKELLDEAVKIRDKATMSEEKVVVYEYQKNDAKFPDPVRYDKVCIGHGVFHAFGVGFEELNSGVGSFSTAIVEMSDGSVKNVPVELIVFNR